MASCSLFLLANCILLSYLSSVADGLTSMNATIQCIKQEREALLQFKQGIEDMCDLLSSWGDPDQPDCCTWHGIHCSHHTGHVIMLDLHGQGDFCLQGTLSPSLLELKHLTYLDLSLNNFQNQPILSFIGSLSNLQHLNLSFSWFSGEIPPQLGNLSKLTSLDLSFNSNLNVKGLEWLNHLTMLRVIDLSWIDLTQVTDTWLQVINNLPFLTSLRMDECVLISPKVPPSLSYVNSTTTLRVLSLNNNELNDTSTFHWLFNLSGTASHLVHLDLSFNLIPGPVPSAFGNMQSLSYLGLSNNNLQGPIPSEFGNLHSLSYLDLSSNNLQGPIPSAFRNMRSLSYLDLSQNNLQGPIPSAFRNMRSLSHLDLCRNKLQGPIPSAFRNMRSLSYLDLSQNNLQGPIPSGLCSLQTLYLTDSNFTGDVSNIIQPLSTCANSSLEYLDLSSNRLQGTLSDKHLSNLVRLNTLGLSDNVAIVINVSANWIPPFQLDHIELSSCKLGPSFPRWLLTQTNFSLLDISSTEISDSIPASFWNSLPSPLETLDLSHNNIHGTLPELSDMPYDLTLVDLSWNCLEGAIPLFPVNVSELYLNNNKFSYSTPLLCPKTEVILDTLDISNNLISGGLPDCWKKFDQLSYLNLANNTFTGQLPASVGSLELLQWLDLQYNSFSGKLPTSLKNITRLLYLDISHNSFIGHIPSSIWNATFATLNLLNLRSNKFEGKLPLSLCQFSGLQVLDLSSNHFSGTIPECIYNLTTMKTTSKIVYFQYTAAMVMWKKKEQSFGRSVGLLRSIAISDNELEGQIPSAISSLTGLGSLDLSRNKLSGSIPTNIGKLTTLQFLDLSSNRLSGGIPTSLANVASLEMLDLSNNNLSGRIPHGTQLQSFSPSNYSGNPHLCGAPLLKCPEDQAPINEIAQQEKNDNDDIFPGLYISVVLGFITGFWAVCGSLVLKRSWRHAYFRFFDGTRDKLYVMFAMSIARLQRRKREDYQ